MKNRDRQPFRISLDSLRYFMVHQCAKIPISNRAHIQTLTLAAAVYLQDWVFDLLRL